MRWIGIKPNIIKDNLIVKNNKLSKELEGISKKLDNRNFVEKAPKHIVEQEKNTYNEIKNDINKINITIKSLKWKILIRKNYQADIHL